MPRSLAPELAVLPGDVNAVSEHPPRRTAPRRRSSPAGAVLVLGATLLLGAACAPVRSVEGYVPDDAALAAIAPGATTRAAVEKALGSPSSKATFAVDGETWYYVTRRVERRSFYRERVLDQQVVAIDIGPDGVVREIRRYGLADARPITPSGRETPTRGRRLGFFEQMFGNIGRFGAGEAQGEAP